MRMTPQVLLRGLAKLLAVVLAAGAAGVVIGVGLAALSGDDASGGGGGAIVPPTTSMTSTARTATTSMRTTGTPTTPGQAIGAPTTSTTPATNVGRTTRVQILSAVLYPAATTSGKARARARLIVRVRLTSRSPRTIPAGAPMLIVGNEAIRSDRRAAASAGELLRPLAAAQSATGELFFETAGDLTRRLTSQARARLSIAARTVEVPIRISSTPVPQG
ncbi:MAG TPA: hypothetical protein VNA28_08005 [Solirubrobacteraceae bacterium]|nr:hypothetical protein [Solirubrobacteraceae bacterium]